MPTPNPNNPKPPRRAPMAPSQSTVGNAVGGMAATLVFVLLGALGVDVDPVAASSITAGCTALGGYFFKGGRAHDTR